MISDEEPPSYEDVIKSDKESCVIKSDNESCDANTFWTYVAIILLFIVVLVVIPIILALTVDEK